ncbi:MAG: Glutamyl-tRNA synthetase [Candidatus Levybacteria bacterium GW2011_GWA2_40_8]|nr:MAG: Glutamyl-tRNA synthetase [Candidatus Levybacteria bacterium GW2011_GWA2_40_8]
MVRVRIAPSPTGSPHIGTMYQALFNYSWAKKNNGRFFVRIEDTDRERFVEGAEEEIFNTLDWIGMPEDESPRRDGGYGPYRQSERLAIYKKHAEELLEAGGAYKCFCSKERLEALRATQKASKQPTMYDEHCRNLTLEEISKNEGKPYVLRLKVPEEGKLTVRDEIRGDIEFDPLLIEDSVLIKSDGFPTYHFAVVVDDHLMKVTHVIRGEEWLSSYPKHVMLYDFFGWEKPYFYHTPNLRNPDKSKLSKRHGHASVDWYRQQGFLPEAILNFLALMGWSHPKGVEEFELSEFVKMFDPKDLKPVGPIFDIQKLEWLNGVYIRKLSLEDLRQRLLVYYKDDMSLLDIFKSNHIDLLIRLAQSRMKKLSDFKELVSPQKPKSLSSSQKKTASKLLEVLSQIKHSDWMEENILNILKNFKNSENISMKEIYFLITGREQGLPLIETMVKIEGREQILENLKSRA